ncbi:hypothetical protein HDF24_14710 [Mucilaginibacter sp. X4EP1]|uniref:carboxylesterase family protein n=1 Tax=Mucilaginibacter sp. X4EP1 TaxID=2723092 RepID=UPI002169E808|nr:hypothetical protein [Mucilaginibacter sp. X4EP1]MCS3815455.1 hypothetical protein [Mucilaginibacter sp. X4EP1]
MNKNLYIVSILFFGLTLASGIAINLLSLQLGLLLFNIDSYSSWFLAANITGITGVLLFLKYCYYQKYRLVFFSGIASIVATLSYVVVTYILLKSGQLRSYYIPTLYLHFGIDTIYALSLIFSNAREKLWLKLAGIYTLIICAILLTILTWGIWTKDFHTLTILSKISQWTSLIGSLLYVIYIMNFVAEIRALKYEQTNNPRQDFLALTLGFAAIIPFVLTIVLGALSFNQSSQLLYWQKYNAEQSQDLVKLAGGAKTFVDGKGDSLHYLLIKPEDYNPQNKYPIVVCLPYGGYESPAAEALTSELSRKTYPAFIFVPYCLKGTGWGGAQGFFPRDKVVYETIDALTEPAIDAKRRYVTGLSLGAYGTWQFICTRPDLFAAAIPVSGAGDPKLAPQAIHVAVWAFHGAKDKNVLVDGDRDMITAMKKAGGHPLYTEYPDEAHNIWNKANDTPGLWNWLFAQKQE